MTRSRFAPSTTGEAHPGTFLSALLVLLDARARGLETVLRFEDLDPQRSSPELLEQMRKDFEWLGLSFDLEQIQSEQSHAHESALDALESAGVLYPCGLSRAEIRARGVRAPDGSFAIDNPNRGRALPGGWRASSEPLRVQLPDGPFELKDESGAHIAHELAEYGDPVVRRRDGALSYQLASVVDDARLSVSRVVRGRDLLAGTLVQIGIQQLLSLPTPSYRHHFLLLERRGEKFSKLHGAIGARQLKDHYKPAELLGTLAYAAGLIDREEPVGLSELDFEWRRVAREDREVDVEDGRLLIR
ncbi:MAG: glutamate--tRNA ligase family protein [Myxococcota bacterium]